MKQRLNTFDAELLKEACCMHSFVKHGTTYFRLWGDGILQAIRLQHEPCFDHYSLNIGLMSMYSSSTPECFCSKSSLPRYSICCINNQANAVSLSSSNGLVKFNTTSVRDQIEILKTQGFDWLDNIDTQSSLLEALYYLDQIAYKAIIWNDIYKLAPSLYLSDFQKANLVISSILDQQLGPDSFSRPPWTEEDFLQYSMRYPNEGADFLYLHKLIVDERGDSINAYLVEQYHKNMSKLHFLRKGNVK
jgi:hypothetical protein